MTHIVLIPVCLIKKEKVSLNINELFWADSSILNIVIENESLYITVQNDALNAKFKIFCSGLAGITDIILWDDVIVTNIWEDDIDESEKFMQKLIRAYGKNANCGGHLLSAIHTKLNVELVSGFTFSVYCHNVFVQECTDSLT